MAGPQSLPKAQLGVTAQGRMTQPCFAGQVLPTGMPFATSDTASRVAHASRAASFIVLLLLSVTALCVELIHIASLRGGDVT